MGRRAYMTCIAAVIEDGISYVGGDSCISSGEAKGKTCHKKVFRIGSLVVGFSGVIRIQNLLESSILKKSLIIPQNIDKLANYVVSCFIPAFQGLLKEHLAIASEEVSSSIFDGEFILAHRNQVVTIGCDFSVSETQWEYAATGCGSSVAYGALYSSGQANVLSPKERIKDALKAAEKHINGVGPPFYILQTKG